MVRDEEKAKSTLKRRFMAMIEEVKKKDKYRRPHLLSLCRDLAEADEWRQQIMLQISSKVAKIQNGGLEEHRLSDLNDEIDRLILEKTRWERRIVELGGPNYTRHSVDVLKPLLEGSGV